jgi:hypothetical protein
MSSHLPEAFPKCLVSLKPIVTARQRIIRIQLISGMYICPYILSDVCTTFTLGKQPNARDCLIIENVPVMTAWLPTTDASIAIASTGHLRCSANG